jgi:hypothetical protein
MVHLPVCCPASLPITFLLPSYSFRVGRAILFCHIENFPALFYRVQPFFDIAGIWHGRFPDTERLRVLTWNVLFATTERFTVAALVAAETSLDVCL